MSHRRRDAFAIAISVVAIAIGSLAVLAQRIEPGLDLQRQPDGTVLVTAVWPGGQASRNGVKVGMYVEYIGDALEDGSFPEGAGPPQGELDPAPAGQYFLGGPTFGDIRAQLVGDDPSIQLSNAGGDIAWVAIALLLACWIRLRPALVPAADPELVRRLILPAAATLVVPVALGPAYLAGTQLGLWSLVVVPALGAWPLVDAASTLTTRRPRRIATILLLAAATSWLAGLTIWSTFASLGPILGLATIFVAVLIPVSAAILAPDPPNATDFEGRLHGAIRAFDLLLVLGAAVSGIVALGLSNAAPGDWANVAMVWLVFIGFRLVVVPFIATARRARSTRDATLDAVEAERVRISGEIHDDVIQDLTMLVRRLDATSDHESATIAREAAGRLRAITGDARLPILDDLGVAAALDWLVQRMRATDGGGLSLTTAESARPPRPIEVAMFRVAQEAVANALRHGAAPVSVHYRSSSDTASLEIVDSGPGIQPDAEAIADGAGRLGIAGMRRRSVAIGASLRIDRPTTGGTRVRLDWAAA
jgi:signal transduction histidine kinase